MKREQKKLLNSIAQIIFDKKGFNIIGIDISDISTLTDYIIIAEGNVDRHVKALASSIVEELKEERDLIPYKTEGRAGGDWIIVDYGEVMIHLFMPQMREKYQLEKLWDAGKIIDLKIDLKTIENLGKEND